MAQGDLFSQLNTSSSRNLQGLGQAAGISSGRQNRDMEQLISAEMSLLKTKKKVYQVDLKSKGLIKGMAEMAKNITKQNSTYLKARKGSLKMEKELGKLEEELVKQRKKSNGQQNDLVDILEKQTKELRYQKELSRLQTDQMKRALPFGGLMVKTIGGINTASKVWGGTMETIHGLFDLLLAPVRMLGDLLLKPWNTFLEIQSITGNLAADIGLTRNETSKWKTDFAGLAIEALSFGGSMQDVATAMKVFSAETNKNKMLDKGQIGQLIELANGTELGVEGATQMAAMFDNMGLSFEKGIELTQQARQIAAKENINNTKLLKDLGQFAKLLNGYELKASWTDMVAKAESLRFDLSSIKSIADKLFDPEGAVEAAAQLQVLGGKFAEMGDPFGLMYAAQNAPEQLADGMMDMVKGMARKSKNGQFLLAPADRKMIEQAASALGESSDNLINAAIEQAKMWDKLAANPILRKGLFKDEDLQAISNLTSVKDGKVMIRMPNGLDKLLSEIPSKDVFDNILEERKKNDSAAIQRKNWSERFNIILDKFMIGFTQPFAELEKILDNKGFFESVEKLGKDIADKFVPWIESLFKDDGKIFKFITGLADGVMGVIKNVSDFFSKSGDQPFLTTLKNGMWELFKGLSDVVLPYMKFAFAKMLEVVGKALPAGIGDDLMRSGVAMQADAVGKSPGLGNMLGQDGVDKLIQRVNEEAPMADSHNNLLTRSLSSVWNLGSAGVKGLGSIFGLSSGKSAMDDLQLSGAQFADGLGGLFDWDGVDEGAGYDGMSLEARVRKNRGLTKHYDRINVQDDSGVPKIGNNQPQTVQDGLVTSSGQIIKYPKGELLAVLAPQQNMGGNNNGNSSSKIEISGSIRLDTPAGPTTLTMNDFRKAGINLIANVIGHEQDKTAKGYGLNDSKDIKTTLAIN